jgi:hypothetical protein
MLMLVKLCEPGARYVGFTIGSNAPSLEAHDPPTHDCVAEQTVPQVPQLFGSVVTFAQPVVQQVWPAAQAGPPLHIVGATQPPFTQVSPTVHGWPQLPQFFGSLVVSLHPVAQQVVTPVQAGPPLHVVVHMLFEQVEPGPQVIPQPPQLFGSLVTFTHPFGQQDWPGKQSGPPLQVGEHMLFEQLKFGGQAAPQPPQLFGSLVVSVHPALQHERLGEQAGPPLHVVVHVLFEHVDPGAQVMLHPPQLFGSLVVSVQPVAQQFRFGGQTGPPWQVAEQLLFEQFDPGGHAMLQPPQLFGSLVVSEHPDAQHESPAAQAGPPSHVVVIVHMLFTHAAPAGQAMSQPPQLFGSLVGSTHMLLHRICTPGHTCLLHVFALQHAPPMQLVVPAGHVSPHPPQFAMSLFVSTQVVPQHERPPVQPVILQFVVLGWQTPDTHVALAPQALPQVPQLFGSVVVFASQPSPTCLSQSAKPALHDVMAHADVSHEVWPLGTAPQVTPHAPQFWLSLAVFAQVVPQQVWPARQDTVGLQVPTQEPPEHAGSDAGHTLPHLPQLFGSSLVFVSQPFATTPSQLPKPGRHPAISHADDAQPATAFAKGPQLLPQVPQSSAFVAVFTQSGVQHVRPFVQAEPLPQNPTQLKFEHSSPEGHWLLVTHSTQVIVSRRQCGVGAAHCASEVQPPGIGTHMCVVVSHCSPLGQSALVVHPPGVVPPVPEEMPSGVRPHAASVVAATSNKMDWRARVRFVIEAVLLAGERRRRKRCARHPASEGILAQERAATKTHVVRRASPRALAIARAERRAPFTLFTTRQRHTPSAPSSVRSAQRVGVTPSSPYNFRLAARAAAVRASGAFASSASFAASTLARLFGSTASPSSRPRTSTITTAAYHL